MNKARPYVLSYHWKEDEMIEKLDDKVPRVLVISPTRYWRWNAFHVLSEQGQAIVEMENDSKSGTKRIEQSVRTREPFDIIMISIDTELGPQLIKKVKQQVPDAYIVATSQTSNWRRAREAFRSGASDFLLESTQSESLVRVLDSWRSDKRMKRKKDDQQILDSELVEKEAK
jgi:DNA-binding NtrC family response regulator